MRHEVKLRITKWSFIIFMKESLEKQNELPPTPWNDSRLTHSFPVGVVHRWDDSSDHNEASRFVQIFSGFFCKQRNKHKKIFFLMFYCPRCCQPWFNVCSRLVYLQTNTKSMAKLRWAKPKNRDGETFKLNKNYKKWSELKLVVWWDLYMTWVQCPCCNTSAESLHHN